jgi:hypothetical protein
VQEQLTLYHGVWNTPLSLCLAITLLQPHFYSTPWPACGARQLVLGMQLQMVTSPCTEVGCGGSLSESPFFLKIVYLNPEPKEKRPQAAAHASCKHCKVVSLARTSILSLLQAPSHMQHLPWLKLKHYFSDFCCLVGAAVFHEHMSLDLYMFR